LESDIPLVYNEQPASFCLVPTLARVRKVDCRNNFQTPVALASRNVFFIYPRSNVEVSGNPEVFLLPQDPGFGTLFFC
jgi:hypothetical protein